MKYSTAIFITIGLTLALIELASAYTSPGGVLRVETEDEPTTVEIAAEDTTTTNEHDPGVTIIEVFSTEADAETSVEVEVEADSGSIKTNVESAVTTTSQDKNVKVHVTEDDVRVQYNETDLEFIRKRAEDETFEVEVEGDIYFESPKTIESKRGSVEYTWKVEKGRRATSTESDRGAERRGMNKSDLIESISVESGDGLRARFIKIEDIKGEAVGDGEARKSKEILIVGSKVREEKVPKVVLPEDDTEYQADSFFDVFVDLSEEDLGLYAVGLAQKNENIREIEITDNEISLEYISEIRLLGVIPIPATQRTTVTFGDGERGRVDRVKVKMPWWHIFGRKTVRPHDIQSALEEELAVTGGSEEETTDDRPTESLSINFAKIQAQTLQTISNIAKAKHNAVLNSVRNFR